MEIQLIKSEQIAPQMIALHHNLLQNLSLIPSKLVVSSYLLLTVSVNEF
jgi:hypothetical protein